MSETLSHAPINNTPEEPAFLTADQIKQQIDSLEPIEAHIDTSQEQIDSLPLSPLDRVMSTLDNPSDRRSRRTEKKIERAAIRAGKQIELAGGDEEAILDAMTAAIEAATPDAIDTQDETDPSAIHPAVINEAYRLNDKYDQKVARQEARAEKVENAKQFLGNIGRSGIKVAKRNFTTFANATEATAGKVGNLVESSISKGIDWLDDAPRRKQAAEERKQIRRTERENAKQEKTEARLQAQREREAAKLERINTQREEARQRANEAIVRKAERRQKWEDRRDRAADYTVSIGRSAHRYSKRAAKTVTGAYAGGKDAWSTN